MRIHQEEITELKVMLANLIKYNRENQQGKIMKIRRNQYTIIYMHKGK